MLDNEQESTLARNTRKSMYSESTAIVRDRSET